MMGGASGNDGEIDTPRRALLQTPSTSERTAPAASVPRSSGAAKKKEAKCQKNAKKGKKVMKSKLKKKPLGGKPPSTPKQVAEKNENPPSQVAPGNQGGGGPMAAPAPDVKIERRDSQEDPLGMLARATTQDMVSDDDLENSMRSPLPSETEGPAPLTSRWHQVHQVPSRSERSEIKNCTTGRCDFTEAWIARLPMTTMQ